MDPYPMLSKVSAFASRTVHIKIHPTPSSFSEQREVLRVLERFGEVTMFKSFKYHPRTPIPNAFLSIFQTEAAAKDVISHSPIRYRSVPDASDLSEASESVATPPGTPEVSGPKPDERIFEAHFSPSDYNHERHIHEHPTYGPYNPVSPKHSAVASHLSRILPITISSAGLCDWETDKVSWKNPGKVGGDGVHVQSRVLQRIRKKKEGERESVRAMSGLKGFEAERIANLARKQSLG